MKTYVSADARRARDWWAELAGKTSSAEADDARVVRGNPGALAELRRARSPLEAMMHPEAIALVTRIAKDRPVSAQVSAAGLAALLAHVREDEPARTVAGRLGGRDADSRLMKAARFRKLMLSLPGEERLTAFRRAVAMMSRTANVADLANAWLSWDHPTGGDRVRTDWMFRYVGQSAEDETTQTRPPEPATDDSNVEETMP